MRIAICDDDINCVNLIEEYIKECGNTDAECDAFPGGEELVRAYRDNAERYDVIFLDMEMDRLNGIETANHHSGNRPSTSSLCLLQAIRNTCVRASNALRFGSLSSR